MYICIAYQSNFLFVIEYWSYFGFLRYLLTRGVCVLESNLGSNPQT